ELIQRIMVGQESDSPIRTTLIFLARALSFLMRSDEPMASVSLLVVRWRWVSPLHDRLVTAPAPHNCFRTGRTTVIASDGPFLLLRSISARQRAFVEGHFAHLRMRFHCSRCAIADSDLHLMPKYNCMSSVLRRSRERHSAPSFRLLNQA